MIRAAVVLACFLSASLLRASDEKRPSYPTFDYKIAWKHEIAPHRHTIPLKGVAPGFNQLRLTVIVSPTGDVVDVKADGHDSTMAFWPQIENETREWKFIPFEENGKAVTAKVEEYISLVPPEHLPNKHVAPPAIRPNSKVAITLERTRCFGSCPSYIVTVSTDGTTFSGGGFVVAGGQHRERVNADDVRNLAKKFVAADFYSMDSSYRAPITDSPTYVLKIAIDGREKEVVDYVGQWEGMPAVIAELENEVDRFAQTERWIQGGDGLVRALQTEKFNFETFDAQLILKEAAQRGETETVRELLDAGVPLEPKPGPKPKEPYIAARFERMGWLNAASKNPETLQVFIDAEASKNDQNDKDLALAHAARSGKLQAVRALVAYGADPNADLGKLAVTETGGGMMLSSPGEGSVLIYAAESGNPELVREILRYHPKLDQRDREGKTAVFAAGVHRYEVAESKRVECVRLLVEAGADVNARDSRGNTPLHETFLGEVEKELLKLGADVNARNNDGETPIFTTHDNGAIELFVEHGADLTIRNNKGETVMEAAKAKGPIRREALRKAIEKLNEQ